MSSSSAPMPRCGSECFGDCGCGQCTEFKRSHQPSVPAARASRKLWIVGGLAAVLTLAGACYYFLHGRAPAQTVTSIAVLPFVNATADPNNEYLTDGLTESLIGTLSQLPNVKVLARSTVFHFKSNEDDPQKIGKLA